MAVRTRCLPRRRPSPDAPAMAMPRWRAGWLTWCRHAGCILQCTSRRGKDAHMEMRIPIVASRPVLDSRWPDAPRGKFRLRESLPHFTVHLPRGMLSCYLPAVLAKPVLSNIPKITPKSLGFMTCAVSRWSRPRSEIDLGYIPRLKFAIILPAPPPRLPVFVPPGDPSPDVSGNSNFLCHDVDSLLFLHLGVSRPGVCLL